MYSIFEHIVDEVGVRLNELIQVMQVLKVFAFLFVENVKVNIASVNVHVLKLRD